MRASDFAKPVDSLRPLWSENALWLLGGVYLATTALLLPIPVFGLLHAESSAVVAAVAFFATGVTAVSFFRAGRPVGQVIVASLQLSLIPLLALTASLLWRPNCGYFLGFVLYATFVFPSVVLGTALSKFTTEYFLRSRFIFVLLGLATLVASVLFDVGFHPQFYTYNHVFGAVLGPIYDEELSIRPGLFIFRFTTLIWAGLLIFLANSRNASIRTRLAHRVIPVCALSFLILMYVFSGRVGLNATYASIARELPVVFETDHFSTHVVAGQFSDDEVAYISAVQEFRYEQLASELAVNVGERIHVYLYPDETSKGRATGSRSTSVTPVWLARPQIHMLVGRHESTFSHELVHVFSREFGLPIIRANPSIGLVEGLAGALEAPDGLPTADAQVAAAFQEVADASGQLAAVGIKTMNPVGFWSGRGAVSYTVANSFTSFLIRELGIEQYKRLYGSFRPRTVLGQEWSTLAERWASELLRNESPDSTSVLLAAARFSVPSLFEKECPHHISSEERLFRNVSESLTEGDTLAARKLLEKPGQYEPTLAYVAAALAISDGDPREAIGLAEAGGFIGLSLIDADARRMMGRDASSAYDSLLATLPPFARTLRAAVIVRKASVADSSEVQLLYGARKRMCDRDRGATASWACINYMEDKKEYRQAAELLSEFDLSEKLPARLMDEFTAFVGQREAHAWLLSGEYVRAEAALQQALLTDYVENFPYVRILLLDWIEFAQYLRDNKNALKEV